MSVERARSTATALGYGLSGGARFGLILCSSPCSLPCPATWHPRLAPPTSSSPSAWRRLRTRSRASSAGHRIKRCWRSRAIRGSARLLVADSWRSYMASTARATVCPRLTVPVSGRRTKSPCASGRIASGEPNPTKPRSDRTGLPCIRVASGPCARAYSRFGGSRRRGLGGARHL